MAFVTDITGAIELWIVAAAGGWPVQLTHLNEYVSDIRWSPDSRWIVFASDYGGNERRDLYRVPAAGGQVEKLTDTPLSESEPRFSSDGKRLAFTADSDRDFHFQLHVLDLETRKIIRLTREAVTLQFPLWSPDGKTIAINRSGDNQKGELLMVDASTGATVMVEPTVKDGILWPEAFSPEGQSLLLRARNPAGSVQLAVLELAAAQETGKPPQPLGPPAFFGPNDRDVTEVRWDKKGIYFLLNEGGKTRLYILSTLQGRALPVDLPEGTARQISLDDLGGQMALLYESITRPADVWIIQRQQSPIKDSNLPLHYLHKPVTFSLLGGVKPEELSTGSMVVYESFDKRKIHPCLSSRAYLGSARRRLRLSTFTVGRTTSRPSHSTRTSMCWRKPASP